MKRGEITQSPNNENTKATILTKKKTKFPNLLIGGKWIATQNSIDKRGEMSAANGCKHIGCTLKHLGIVRAGEKWNTPSQSAGSCGSKIIHAQLDDGASRDASRKSDWW